jgi:hypothetical protein
MKFLKESPGIKRRGQWIRKEKIENQKLGRKVLMNGTGKLWYLCRSQVDFI